MNSFLYSLSIKDQVLFAKRLSFLVHAGVPILQSLKILKEQTTSRSKAKIFEQVMVDVANGKFLATSLAKFRRIFGDFAINIIRIGESSGTLDQNLNYLAEELNKKQQLRRKVMGALVYPALIIVATLGITAMLTLYVFPKILPIFESLNVTLPITTRILIYINHFLSNYGLYLIGGIVLGAIVLTWLVVKKHAVHLFVDNLTLRIPLMGKIALNYHTANFCRTLGLLLKSGIRVVEAFKITAETMTSLVYRKELEIIAAELARGEKISKHLEKHKLLFPPILTQMIAIGETTGNLSETLVYLSELYEDEVDQLTKNLSNALEPVLMVFMGAIVGFIAISIITPIYEVTQNLNP